MRVCLCVCPSVYLEDLGHSGASLGTELIPCKVELLQSLVDLQNSSSRLLSDGYDNSPADMHALCSSRPILKLHVAPPRGNIGDMSNLEGLRDGRASLVGDIIFFKVQGGQHLVHLA